MSSPRRYDSLIDPVYVQPWVYGTLPLDSDSHLLEPFRDLLALWNSKRRGPGLPLKKDFDFYDFSGWHGRIVVDEIEWNPFDVRCRLFGTRAVEIYGQDQTGHRLSEYLSHPVDGPHYKVYMDCIRRAAENGQFVYLKGYEDARGRRVGMEWLMVPCADDAGKDERGGRERAAYFFSEVQPVVMDMDDLSLLAGLDKIR